MRKIVIPQPWASMIAAGVINVFDLGIDLGTEPCIVLIVAAPWQKYDNRKKIPLEWLQALEMAQLLGLVPLYQEMSFNCIIGYVTAVSAKNLTDSIWAYGSNPETLYQLVLPFIFDETMPVQVVVTEDHLMRASEPFPEVPYSDGTELCVQVNKDIFHRAVEGFWFSIPLTDAMARLLLKDGKNIEYHTVMLKYGFHVKRFLYQKENDFYISLDINGKPKRYYSINKERKEARAFFKIHLEHKIY